MCTLLLLIVPRCTVAPLTRAPLLLLPDPLPLLCDTETERSGGSSCSRGGAAERPERRVRMESCALTTCRTCAVGRSLTPAALYALHHHACLYHLQAGTFEERSHRAWAKQRLGELLRDQQEGGVTLAEVSSVTGDCNTYFVRGQKR